MELLFKKSSICLRFKNFLGLPNARKCLALHEFKRSVHSKLKIQQVPHGLEITFSSRNETGKASFFDSMWLRDHCRCPKCYNQWSMQKEVNYLDIAHVYPVEGNLKKSSQLSVKWSDEHLSVYDLNWLQENHFDYHRTREKCEILLWDDALKNTLPNVNYSPEMHTTEFIRQVITNVFRYGFVLINNVNPTMEYTEQVIRQIAPAQKTFWGEMWSVYAENNDTAIQDTAFTNLYIPPHNDCTYFADTPALQIFHCYQKSESGGETILVDGYKAAEMLKKTDPTAYQYLSTTAIESSYEDNAGNYFSNCDTVIKHVPNTTQLLQIRFNPLDVAAIRTIPQLVIRNFYSSYTAFTREVYKTSNHLLLNLEPGTVLIMDNWRVLHGRNAFQGNRRLCGCYISRTEYMSKLLKLGLA